MFDRGDRNGVGARGGSVAGFINLESFVWESRLGVGGASSEGCCRRRGLAWGVGRARVGFLLPAARLVLEWGLSI